MTEKGDFPPPESDEEKREVPLFDKDFENLLKSDPDGLNRFKRKSETEEEPDVIIGTPPINFSNKKKDYFPNELTLNSQKPIEKKRISFASPPLAESPPIAERNKQPRQVHFLAQPIGPGKKSEN
ncbi:hypothetical protein TVAG_312470 [Trichomonas vaginalis G3]|uniref:Uncharacterized protein n=1 Tax=Trichomonas vaginalis (strain ATCC PRA-98 / G3) TaxID=412133 RepID=A2EHQ2_TRIV3|nr:hypothetical protein TVAGG3_0242740 [Trichomonas vaginalis G3]EAY07848.1 hypothetical protein TVAG_312470 [Trichomonas vaginalis G3]KAI5553460.1 hypothetical protein TVAGG3_0242740 [Trichomonas vaginalis G3]|eukprot:XP_001320071.1 hypothetical protein [Trichomonas vaginalis G3]